MAPSRTPPSAKIVPSCWAAIRLTGGSVRLMRSPSWPATTRSRSSQLGYPRSPMSGAAGSRTLTRSLSELPTNRIVALHPPFSKVKVAALSEDMKRNGWKGRPLLSVGPEEGVYAWTGSHRLAAALLAELPTIPVDRYVIAKAQLAAVLSMFDSDEPWDLTEGGDKDRLEKLCALRAAGFSGVDPAIELMRQELS